MNAVMKIVSGVFVLILVFLVLSRAKESTSIISTFSSNAIKGVAVLQGRETKVISV